MQRGPADPAPPRDDLSDAERRLSTDPDFFARRPPTSSGSISTHPDNALARCVDEKPGIQGLYDSQGWLRLPDGRALTGFADERHGTTTLFAALEVVMGLIQTGHHARRRRCEFLDFMNEVLTAHPSRTCSSMSCSTT